MSTATTKATNQASVPAPSTDKRPSRNRLTIASLAFLAILRRDIVVTGREFISFLMQVLLQP
ncbi:MAG: hypothetical protein ABI396_07775, partial [Ktedonobacteraceae bacterium]